MTWQRIAQIGLELAVCAVHPVPGKYMFSWTTKMANQGGHTKTEVSCGLDNGFSNQSKGFASLKLAKSSVSYKIGLDS